MLNETREKVIETAQILQDAGYRPIVAIEAIAAYLQDAGKFDWIGEVLSFTKRDQERNQRDVITLLVLGKGNEEDCFVTRTSASITEDLGTQGIPLSVFREGIKTKTPEEFFDALSNLENAVSKKPIGELIGTRLLSAPNLLISTHG